MKSSSLHKRIMVQMGVPMSNLYIGALSGTSMDAIDVALVDFTHTPGQLVATHHHPMPMRIKEEAQALITPTTDELNRISQLDSALGDQFGQAILSLLKNEDLSAAQITAIGSHGQTIRHMPNANPPYTIQIGDPNIIRAKTGITTVSDFRRADLAVGGQGAPLTPLFHRWWLKETFPYMVLNIGGIANLTYTGSEAADTIGFDTGPGNCLMDEWCKKHFQIPYDSSGELAKAGQVIPSLLSKWLSDPYFQKPNPKSTGREYFNLSWLAAITPELNQHASNDVLASLNQLTAQGVCLAISQLSEKPCRIILCGGGSHNQTLVERMRTMLPQHEWKMARDYGLHEDWLEAYAFAWFAKETYHHRAQHTQPITGGQSPVILGGIYPAKADLTQS